MIRPDWDRRIRRSRELAEQYPAAAEVLCFYAEVAAFQQGIFEAATAEKLRPDPARPLREQFESSLVLRRFPALLDLVAKKGPPGLAKAAREVRQQAPDAWDTLLDSQARSGGHHLNQTQTFFARACLQPLAEYLVSQSNVQVSGYTGAVCPVCNGRPQMAVLRPEGEGGKRSLLCSCCLSEWDFRRILCPFCGEEDHRKLPHYSAEEFPHVRVECCDTCSRYLKTVDLTANGLAVPLVDEIAAASLDLWASEHGYQKIELNLMGM